jgi:hypothetical protein
VINEYAIKVEIARFTFTFLVAEQAGNSDLGIF